MPAQIVAFSPLVNEFAIAQSQEGQLIREQIEQIHQHWYQRSSTSQGLTITDTINELNEYRSPDFPKAGIRRVKYLSIKTLQPRRFAIDEDE
jgi:hypothetical protein